MTTAPDVVVVGAGGSGAALAARLAEGPARHVLLLEAGPMPLTRAAFPAALLDPLHVPGAHPVGGVHERFDVLLTDEAPYAVWRGRIAGGSTATNGGYFVHARRMDFARWSAHGDAAWTWDAVQPLLAAVDRAMPARRPISTHPFALAAAAAAVALGLPAVADADAQGSPGFGPVPLDLDASGRRTNTALAYLSAPPPNLEVRGGAAVARVLLAGGRAVGVELADGERVAAGEVVLCAGAFASPAILLRSGIDPAGIGEGFGDHPQVVVEARPLGPMPRATGSWLGGMLTARSAGGPAAGDLELLVSTVPMSELTGGAPDPLAPLPLLVGDHAPVPRGRLALDDAGRLRIHEHSLESAADRRRLREGVRLAEQLVRAAPGFALADPAPVDDAGLDVWIRGRIGTAVHACATVPFRLPDGSPGPVDATGRVRAVAGLRVADTSILPTAPLRGPAHTAVLIGELVARSFHGVGETAERESPTP